MARSRGTCVDVAALALIRERAKPLGVTITINAQLKAQDPIFAKIDLMWTWMDAEQRSKCRGLWRLVVSQSAIP
jgi:hypothetical protein